MNETVMKRIIRANVYNLVAFDILFDYHYSLKNGVKKWLVV